MQMLNDYASQNPADDSVNMVTELMRMVYVAREEVERLKVRVDRHDQLLRCAAAVNPFLLRVHRSPSTCTIAALLSRNHASSLMTVEEVEADATTRRTEFEESGSCQRAATQAKIFFGDTHSLMRPTVVRGVLYAPSDGLLLRATGAAPATDPGAVVHGQAFALRRAGGGVWERRSDISAPDPALNAMGYIHYVTMVFTGDRVDISRTPDQVAIDWSMGQFSHIPIDILLFLPPA